MNKKDKSIIAKLFMSLSRGRHLWQVWNDVITISAISISNAMDFTKVKDERSEEHETIIKGYKKEEIGTITKIFANIVESLEQNPNQDLLGDLYMELELGSDSLGQFFTPYHLCELMSKMSFNKELAEKEIAENGYITLNEPTCGAGANIIAFANECRNNGINYQEHLKVIAQDISRTTALMCYVQLSLLGCDAVIIVGDTLRSPATDVTIQKSDRNIWRTPIHQLHQIFKNDKIK